MKSATLSRPSGAEVAVKSRVGRLARVVLGVRTATGRRHALFGYLFVSPWLLGLLIFWAGPIIASLALSFSEYSLVKFPEFVGLANFRRAFTDDVLFRPSLGRTFYYAVIYVPIVVTGSLLLSVLLNQHLLGTDAARTLFFLPHLTPQVALGVLWLWLLHPRVGAVNNILRSLGGPTPGWLTSEATAMPSVILINLWAGFGGDRMLIFLAGLQGVPQALYEAAEIDGAGAWAKFWHVTMPMISPVIFLNLVLGVIGALKVFTVAFVTTGGGPAYATWFFALHIYNQAFKYYRMGYGSTLAWILAVILLVFSLAQFKLAKRWVFYAAAG